MNNPPVRVHFDMQFIGIHCGMGTYETELALRLMKYDDLNITASYFLLLGKDRKVDQFNFPVKRAKIPTPLIYHVLSKKKRRLLHAMEKPIFWMMRPFLSYNSLVRNTGDNVYVFFENRIPRVPVKGKIIAAIMDIIPMKLKVKEVPETVTRKDTEEILKRADKIITISKFTRNDIAETFHVSPDRFEVVPCAINASDFAGEHDVSKYGLPEKYILYFGSCATHKNVESLVKSYALLPSDLRAEYPLVITNPSDSVKACAEGCGVSGQVQYLYRVPDADKPGIYRGASVFVWPSLYEGFGIPILEAQASGVPVVSSNAGVMPEVTGDSAVLADPKDTESIASAIQRVLTDEALHSDLVMKGFENIKRFSWDESAQKLHDIITSL